MARPARRPGTSSFPALPTHFRSMRCSLRCRVDAERGLRTTKVARRRGVHGRNELGEDRGIGWVRLLWNQLASAVVVLLLGAGIVGFVVGETVEAIAILVVLVVNAVVGFATELQAARSMAALRELMGTVADVERDNRRDEIDAAELVPGDIVGIEAGEQVPADIRLIEAEGLQVEEAGLTGESDAVTKSTDPVAEDAGSVTGPTWCSWARPCWPAVAVGSWSRPAVDPDGTDRRSRRLRRADPGAAAARSRSAQPPAGGRGRGRRRGAVRGRAAPGPRGRRDGRDRGRARDRRRPRGAARGRDAHPRGRDAPDGRRQRARASAPGRGDARVDHRGVLRQDRHPHPQRDGGRRPRPRRRRGPRPAVAGRGAVQRRRRRHGRGPGRRPDRGGPAPRRRRARPRLAGAARVDHPRAGGPVQLRHQAHGRRSSTGRCSPRAPPRSCSTPTRIPT
jgi:hypothetical protein